MKFSKPLQNVGQGIYGWATLLLRWMYLTASPKARLTVSSTANPTLEIQVVDSLTETPIKSTFWVRVLTETIDKKVKSIPPYSVKIGDMIYNNSRGSGNDNNLNPIIETNTEGRILIYFTTPASQSRIKVVVLGHATSQHIAVRS